MGSSQTIRMDVRIIASCCTPGRSLRPRSARAPDKAVVLAGLMVAFDIYRRRAFLHVRKPATVICL